MKTHGREGDAVAGDDRRAGSLCARRYAKRTARIQEGNNPGEKVQSAPRRLCDFRLAKPFRSGRIASQRRLRASQAARLFALCFSTLLIVATTLTRAENGADESAARAGNLHQWGAVTLFHGLPSDQVHAIAQDGEGVMWFGTARGLAKFDGRRTQTIASEGLLARRVLVLKVDQEGVLWIGTEEGAARLVAGDFQPITETEGKAVTAIITPERGRAFLATGQGVIFECRSAAEGRLAVRSFPGTPLESADADKPGSLPLTSLATSGDALLVGTHSRGLLKIEGDSIKEVQGSPRPFFVNALETDAKGRLWLGARARGLYDASDPSHPRRTGTEAGTVKALRADAGGGLWVGTEGHGAIYYSDSQTVARFTFESTAGGLRSDNILAVFVDGEGVVWFGTDRGVCRYDPQSPHNEDVSSDRMSNFVRTLYQTGDGRLLCGTNRGLFIYDQAASRWQPFGRFNTKTVYAIAEDTQGRLLVGSSSGLYIDVKLQPDPDAETVDEETDADGEEGGQVEEEKEEEKEEEDAGTPGESVRAIRTFQGAAYIAIYGRGIERLGPDDRRTLVWPGDTADKALREVTSLHADKDKRLWIGTARLGVFVFDGKQVTQGAALEKTKGSAVWAIDGDSEQGLWFATSNGLYRYRSGELLKTAADADVRHVVVGDQGGAHSDVWCATSGGGLLRLVIDEQAGVLLSQLDVEQGLSSQKAFALLRLLAGSDGHESLLIGTTRGIVRYSPGKAAPSLVVTRLLSRRVHQPEELRRGISLDYPQNSLALDVTALSSRTYPEQFQYAFLLRDGAGRVIKRKLSADSQFLMDNLKPGPYRVEVRAFTKDLVASAPLTFEFHIARAPFPWTTTALSVLLTLALVALVWAIIEHRRIMRASSALGKANRELAGARLQLANEAERERRRIARDLHDQTLADLRHLLLLADQLPAEQAGNGHTAGADRAVFRAEIESVSGEIRRICEDLSPSVLENVGLAAALEWALANAVTHAPPECKFEYEFVCDEGLEERMTLAPGVKIQIYRIAQEA
ncbi:MAG TPA: two-component regulator propeller domain-containing protein, partial [Pyrinomonadaceae bacterium]|nr:two-component regulator propeller domain-containing protein [Pyrinomonadaceae bacterium]